MTTADAALYLLALALIAAGAAVAICSGHITAIRHVVDGTGQQPAGIDTSREDQQ